MSTYNGEKYLSEQLDSIIHQETDAELHICIRDDGSKDNTIRIIKDYQKNYPSLIDLIEGTNIGVNASYFELVNQ